MFKHNVARNSLPQVSIDEAIRKLERGERWALAQAKKMRQEAALTKQSNPGRHSYMILKADQFTSNAEEVNKQLKALVAKRDYKPGFFQGLCDLVKAHFFTK